MEPIYMYPTPATVKAWSKQDEQHSSEEKIIICGQQQGKCKHYAAHPVTNTRVVLAMLVAILSLVAGTPGLAQTSRQTSVLYKNISPEYDHYKTISAADETSKGGNLENITFLPKDFRRGAYLKMRTVYLNVPVGDFHIKPYPANSSEETRKELDLLLTLQQKRTAFDVARTDTMAAVYYDPFTVNLNDPDYSRNVESLFYVGRNIGPWFTPDQLPVTSRVLQNVIQDATFYFFSLKVKYNRARPYQLEPALQNLEAPGHASYPSGHSSASHVHAYLLSYLFPELRAQLLGNAYDMAFSREIRGVHYPSDSEAGKEFAKQFVDKLMKSKKFKADFAAMKAEIEKVRNQYPVSARN